MGTCGCPRTRCLALVLYWMDFNAAIVHSSPFPNTSATHTESRFMKWSYSAVLKREQRSLFPFSPKTSSEVPSPGPGISQIRSKLFKQLAFSKPVYSFELEEDTVPGTTLGYVEASHALQDRQISYSLVEDDGDGLFLLNPVSGEVTLSRALDYESEQTYILTLGAGYGEAQFAWVRVYVNVLDVNDNPPVFSFDAYTVSVLEDIPVGTCIFGLNVTDADDGVNAELNSAIISGDNEGRFAVGSNGIICLQRALDRETESIYSLTIQVSDCALPEDTRLTSTAHITVYIEDVNDNAPFFTSGEKVHVPENMPVHSVVTVVHALDVDAGANSAVEYVLEHMSGNTFRIDSSSGRVYLQKELDREQTSMLTVLLTVRDKGSPQLSSSMNLSVFIDDVNDNAPIFTQSSYKVTVMEDVPRGLPLCQVFASDADGGPNGQIRYSIYQSQFVIDSLSGDISVMGSLDREKHPSYTLTVIAMDQGDVPRSATATVHVLLTDVNDFVPTFSPSLVTVHVLENLEQLPLAIEQVSAIDEDLGVNSQLTYTITRGNEDELFALSPTGTLSVWHSLDRELKAHYTLEVIAVDSGLPSLTGTGTVLIIVDDLNDNRPLFLKNIFSVAVNEDARVGTSCTTINASDLDEGVNGQIRYSLQDTSSSFSIDQSSGVIFTTAVLDREAVGKYTLKVIGTDMNTTHPLSSSAIVSVEVQDVNDQWPQFLNGPYVANVPDTITSGSIVCAVRAVDLDTGINAQLTFSLFGSNSDQFTIDPIRGVIFAAHTTTAPKDMTLSVRVRDGGKEPKTDTTTVTVRFQSASQIPRVAAASHEHLLSEDVALNTQITVVTAESERRGLVGPISYYLAAGNFEEAFQVHQQTGILTVNNPLDYETNSEFQIWVEARDAGLPPYSSYIKIHISISDVNDNAPVFTRSSYRCEVFENMPASLVCQVLAVDLDRGFNGEVQYSILTGDTENTFTVDADTGVIRTRKSIDREKTWVYNLTVQARDKGNRFHTGTTLVVVTVLDTNDNAPRFSQIFFTEIPENTPVGFTVIQITSTDADIGVNAVSTYMIVNTSGSVPFAIDNSNGYVTVIRPLDREIKDRYVVRVNANDSAWSVNTEVTIYITDINDNRPVFSQLSYSITIPETKAREVFILQVNARDSDLGQNGQVFYYIQPPSDLFKINASTGDVLTKQPISLHEVGTQNHSFLVVASDCGVMPNLSNVTVRVNFVQYNYFPPMFLPFQPLISVPFNLDVGTKVMQLSAIDKDSGDFNGTVEYFVTGGNASRFFKVEQNSGSVFVNTSLKQIFKEMATLLVTAKDKGVPPLSTHTSVSFLITENNHFAPHFSATQVTFVVREDLPVGSVIGKVKAEDKDPGPNGILHYSIIEAENEEKIFSIGQSTGFVTLIASLDFDKQKVHSLQVTAKDDGWISKTGNLNVIVEVQDVNDNPPIFSATEYLVSLPENLPIGTTVLQVKATDMDSGVNSQISYSLLKGDVDGFALDSQNGVLTTQEVFDFELQQNYEVTVKASNTDSQGHFSLAQVHILITDVNEYRPRFSRSQYHFTVSERALVGTKVGHVFASDSDLGVDGEVFYLLIGQSKKAGFDIDKRSGDIFVTGDLKQHAQNQAVLRILAKNKGSITGTDVEETLVLVSVMDANDPPTFSSSVYHVDISEGTAVGTSVVKVKAEDQDFHSNWNNFSYSIESGNHNGSFSVHPVTGFISIVTPLDREQWAFYNLTVTAIDGAPIAGTGSTKVLIVVSDINDNAPILSSVEGHVRENEPHGTIVTIMNATDADLPPNQGPFTYQLGQSEASSYFTLTSDGVLSTIRPLDREEHRVFPVIVVIQDAGIPPQSATATVHITVLDENDNPPMVRNMYIEVKYYGSSFSGGLIGNVRPEDPDVSDEFNCSLRIGPRNLFSFPSNGCDLWSSPYQGEAKFNLTIAASDNRHIPVNSSVYVNYKGFTNATIDNCILFYVTSPQFEVFLSINYLKLIKALDSLFNLQASKIHVFGMKPLGNTTLLLAAVKNYNGQYISGTVASGIFTDQKEHLEAQSNIKISLITSDPCFSNPCHHQGTCNKNVDISQDISILESSTVIFVSPKHVEIFNCSCLPGYTGLLCELDIDECNGGPCDNGAACVNYPGGFSCNCTSGYSGPFCSSDINECKNISCHNGGTCLNIRGGFYCDCNLGYVGQLCEHLVDHCASSSCLQGTCVNSPTGYTCSCPFGVSGTNCEEYSYGFEELSYMEFPPLDSQNNVLSLELATVQENALLLYNYGSKGGPTSEFLALEIVDRKARLSYNLGNGTVRLNTEKIIADGHFHTVSASRTGKVAALEVDSCSEEESDGFCYSRSEGIGVERTLDVGSNNMMFGGIKSIDPILLRPGQVRTDDFIGCVKDVWLNGVPLNPFRSLAARNVLDSCPRKGQPCGSYVCLNGGTCHDHWSFHLCQCLDGFTGENCDAEISEDSALQLNGEAFIDFVIKESHRRKHQMRELLNGSSRGVVKAQDPTGIEIKMKSTLKQGMLLHIQGTEGLTTLKITDGKLHYVSEDRSSIYMEWILEEALLSDGDWHLIQLHRNEAFTNVFLDKQPILTVTNHTHDFTGINVERILLGGIPQGEMRPLHKSGFRGCIAYLRYNGRMLPFSGFNEVVEARPSHPLVQAGCVSASLCVTPLCSEQATPSSCLTQPCMNGGTCNILAGGSVTCSCVLNFTGVLCELCSSSFENRAACHETEARAPLWITAIVVPACLVLMFLVIVLFRAQAVCCIKRSQESKSLQKGKQGADNKAFCDDSADASVLDVPDRKDKQPDVIKAETQRHTTEHSISTGQPGLYHGLIDPDLEYYEIESTSSDILYESDAFHLRHTPKHNSTCYAMGAQVRVQRELPNPESQQLTKMSAKECKEQSFFSGLQTYSSHLVPEGTGNLRPAERGEFSKVDYESGLDLELPFLSKALARRTHLPEAIGPPLGLSVEEVKKLNAPQASVPLQGQLKVRCHPPQRVYAAPAKMPESSSESESHSSFTCSEYEYEREHSFTNKQQAVHSALADYHIRQEESRKTSTPDYPFTSYDVDRRVDSSSPEGAAQHWESLLNLGLHFQDYAAVFEDIANLPIELENVYTLCADRRSELEEIF